MVDDAGDSAEREKVARLVGFLGKVGFNWPEMEADIREELKVDRQNFGLRHVKRYNGDAVGYELTVHLDFQFDEYRLTGYKATYFPGSSDTGMRDAKELNHRVFGVGSQGVCHPDVAYHHVSGRFQRLFDLLAAAGFTRLPNFSLHGFLEKALAGNPDAFDVVCARNEAEGRTVYSVPVQRRADGEYAADTIHASFIPHTGIRIDHGVFGGVDSAKLEDELKSRNWSDEFYPPWPAMFPHLAPWIGDMLDKMDRMCADREGAAVADRLKLKYLLDIPDLEHVITRSVWELLDERKRVVHSFPLMFGLKPIFNFMCGRWVYDRLSNGKGHDAGVWICRDSVGREGRLKARKVRGFTECRLQDCLDLLPVQSENDHSIRNSLMDGNCPRVELRNGKEIRLSTDPERSILSLHTPEMKPIPFNFGFDPDWKPSEKTGQRIKQREIPKPRRNQKNQGKGI